MGLGHPLVQKRSDADQDKSLGTDCCRHGDRLRKPITWGMRALRVRAPILKILAARKAYKQERYRGTERRQQLRDESRLELFFRMGAALTISLGAGTGLQLEDTRHRRGGASLRSNGAQACSTRS